MYYIYVCMCTILYMYNTDTHMYYDIFVYMYIDIHIYMYILQYVPPNWAIVLSSPAPRLIFGAEVLTAA